MGWNEEALYDLSEMPGVKRSISNWLRLVFKSRRMPFSWMGSRDSWRYAHVEYKHYPFAKVCRAPFCTIQADMEFNAGLGFPGEGHGEGYIDFHYLALWSYGFSFDEAPGGLFGIYSFFHYSNLWLVAACLLWMSGGLFDKYLPSGLRQADYQNFRQLLLGFLAGNALKHPHAMHSEPLKALGLFPLEWTSDGMNFSRQDFLWVFPAREGFPMALWNLWPSLAYRLFRHKGLRLPCLPSWLEHSPDPLKKTKASVHASSSPQWVPLLPSPLDFPPWYSAPRR